ncbi:HoxN/HupN/NixA family nickel/cobalt transporter [Pseudooceanicola sp. CBS1P-1]|uniref:Nickel/cobalt efflux system n=1 Tax=Pseudooceanicola albus TaxID=2692189 RepID=A0A6L7G0I5_9RHOB|nr:MULTISPECIES: HoxN/HupN/NixA family nickel/cobalt transporter [Pseudooceanicola]MBT9383594.1 HoxN/HupN/NixA family nickel/cobalt transporter [Pseudooceanicola endophyticus]MXN17449.1 HoxN/HupN/NixA family nickel/cobalt transporter [Pseudooceanicola albus]
MSSLVSSSGARGLRRRVSAIYVFLILFNLGAWIWAFVALDGQPLLLSAAAVAWGFGLRHAVDADHIAAIDNVTRKLMQEGRRPVTVGLFFALGHSTVVLLVSVLVGRAAIVLQGQAAGWQAIGSAFSTCISALFLFLIAGMNIVILRGVWRAFRDLRRGLPYAEEDLDLLLGNRGLLARLVRPMFRLVSRPVYMLPLGFLFGLGFDTATEVSLLGMSAHQAAQGVSMSSMIVLPVLFAAGMSLVDTTDGILMLGAYEWAFLKPVRKIYYNLCITLVAVVVAVLIGGIEALGLLGQELDLTGAPWRLVGALNDNFDNLGFLIIGIFLLAWVLSYAIYRMRGYDRLDPVRLPADRG